MTQNNIKKPAIRAILSLAMASTIFLSSNLSTTTVHACNSTESIANFKKNIKGGKNYSDKTVILSTNDIHGAVQNYPYVASLKKFFENDLKSDVILVDSGDFSSGKNMAEYGMNCMEAYDVLAMNAIGYDLATLGNYEFGGGFDTYNKCNSGSTFNMIDFDSINKAVEKAKGSSASTDVFKNFKQKDYLCNNSYIYDCSNSDLKIGFFGLNSSEAGAKASKDKNTNAEKQVEALKKQGADLVVCLSQLGAGNKLKDKKAFEKFNSLFEGKGSYEDYIDLIVDGYSLVNACGSNDSFMSGNSLLKNIGVTIIDNKSKKIEDNLMITIDDIIKNLGADKEAIKYMDDLFKTCSADYFSQANCNFDYSGCSGKSVAKGSSTCSGQNQNVAQGYDYWFSQGMQQDFDGWFSQGFEGCFSQGTSQDFGGWFSQGFENCFPQGTPQDFSGCFQQESGGCQPTPAPAPTPTPTPQGKTSPTVQGKPSPKK